MEEPMPGSVAELHDQRLAIMDRIVHELAAECGLDISQGLPATERHRLIYDAEVLVEQWFERVQDGELIAPTSPIETLLAELYDLDTDIHEAMEGGRRPEDKLQ